MLDAFHLAIATGNVTGAQALIDGPGMATAIHDLVDGFTPLQIACEQGHTETVRWLLGLPGIDVLQTGRHGLTALHVAVMNTAHPELVLAFRALLPPATFQTLANTPDGWGLCTPASLAAQLGLGADVVDGLRPTAITLPVALPPASAPRAWAILGDEQLQWSNHPLDPIFDGTGIAFTTCGNGNTSLRWDDLQALDIRSGDIVAGMFHAEWSEKLQRVMVKLGKEVQVPLVDVARLLRAKGAKRVVFAGCAVAKAAEAMLRSFRLDLQDAPASERKKAWADLDFALIGGEGSTIAMLNVEGVGYWCRDSVHACQNGSVGDTLHRRSVQALTTIGWDAARETLTIHRRAPWVPDSLGQPKGPERQKLLIDLMFMCANDGEWNQVEDLLSVHGVDPDARDGDGGTVLQLMCATGNLPLAQQLMQHHPKIDAQDAEGCSALHTASMEGHLGLMQLLLDHGASVDMVDKIGLTPLLRAAQCGHVGGVMLLLERGAKVNHRDVEGRTALYFASYLGHAKVVRHLLLKGADAHLRDSDSLSPLDVAIANEHDNVIALLQPKSEETQDWV